MTIEDCLAQIEALIQLLNAKLKTGQVEGTQEAAATLITRLDDRALASGDMTDSQKRKLTSVQTQAATILRKLAFVDDALKLCRRACAAGAGDIWVVRAYGWALRDAIKKAKLEKNDKGALDLVLEFDRLQIPESETLLLEQRAHYHVGLVGTEQHLAEAFRAARQRHRENPDDSRAAQSYFWVLADCIKQAVWMKKTELAKQFHDEITKLPLNDDKQKNEMLRLTAELDPTNALRQEARAFDKQGDHVKAAALCREALRIAPTSRESQEGLGWALARLLKDEIQRDKPDGHKVKEMLREYLSLEKVEKPSVLHSWMLSHATRAREILDDLYPSFVKKWGVENLRDEDCQPYKPEGKNESFPSLAERMGMALGKAVKAFKGKALPKGVEPAWICEVLANLVARFSGNQWLTYHYAKALMLSGNMDAARATLLPIVRSKQTEFWVWAALADTFARKTAERLACLARAALCRVRDRDFLKGVLARLRSELQNANEQDAVRELEKIIPDRRAGTQQEGPLEEDEELIAESALSQEGSQEEDKLVVPPPAHTAPEWETIRAVCEKYAPMADEIVLGGVPWIAAVISGRVAASGDTKGYVFVLYDKGNCLAEARVKSGKHAVLDDAKIGSPVSIRTSQVDGRDLVVSASPREGGVWDLLPERLGVVKNVNQEKRVTAIATGADEFALAYFEHFPEARQFLTGQTVSVRLQASRPGVPPRLVSIEKSDAVPDVSFYRPFEGKIRINPAGGFGFVEDVYVPKFLLDMATINGAHIVGSAVFELNPKTGKRGWRALTVKNVK